MSDLAHTAIPSVTTAQIQLKHVVKDFGRNRIIDHLDLSIPQGQKVALIGPSGSGKSTVLRLIKGLENYQQGSIEVAGETVPARASGWRWPGARKAPVEHYPSQLSGGQQQRVAIARALAMRPQVMLFDEVTSALDPELVGEVLAVIRSIAHEFQMTMLLVTHEMKFAQDIADRVLFMEGGRIVADGTPSEILLNPQNERTRRFLQRVEQR
ncbi:amino acid ABC transporter ATP-binding protein [Pseudomonas syringae]|uniref:amino acid ABC transporter ATP-binding protein n=1 Tax=Pseudomonas syringae TaxID=317 RepID=UPI000467B0DE|nr:ATP-binding cassette domain-containing protein [Pseudomonas syringae]